MNSKQEINQANEMFEAQMPESLKEYGRRAEILKKHDRFSLANDMGVHKAMEEYAASLPAAKPVSEDVEGIKNLVAKQKGYPSWKEMENWIIDHNEPVNVAVLLVGAMDEVAGYAAAPAKGMKKEATIKAMVTEIFGQDAGNDPEIVSWYEEVNKVAIEEYFSKSPSDSEAGDTVDYKAKYEKCISIIKRFDAGIIGLYDL